VGDNIAATRDIGHVTKLRSYKRVLRPSPHVFKSLPTSYKLNIAFATTGVPEYRYGIMVTVLGITCSPRWSDTPRGLEIGGPAAMGYKDVIYKPLGKYVEPKSVVLEYAPK